MVIYNGIDYHKFKRVEMKNNEINSEFNSNDIIITSVGVLRKEKGVQYLIKAAPLIIESVPNVKFLIVGDGPYRKNLERLVEKYNLRSYFFFAGRVLREIQKFYSISSCVVAPSLSEGHPFVALEAMAAEVPVVAFSSGGLKEVVVDGVTGYLVTPKNYIPLSEKIIEIVKDENIKKAMGKESRKRLIEKFSLEICINNYVQVYKEVLI